MMTDKNQDVEDETDWKDGVQMLITQGALIAMLPVERWLEELNRAETLAPILDPTLFRDYLYSGRDHMLKDVLNAAIQYKAAILKAQKDFKDGKLK